MTALFGADADISVWPLPLGICAGQGWELVQANAALARLLDMGANPPNNALAVFLEQGSLEAAPGNGCERLLLRHNSGRAYVICFWSMPDAARRMVLIIDLPPQCLQNGADASLAELDSILESIHDGIWVIDGNGITTRINRAMERIAGIRAAEVVGRHVSEPLREGRFRTCVTLNALSEKRTVTLFDDYANGKRCLNTSAPILDRDGNVWRVIAAIRDITELDELKARLSRLEVETLAHRARLEDLEDDLSMGLLGQSQAMQRVLQDISRAAQTDAVTLIEGETGTGKTLAAKVIHQLGSRAQRPFVSINCGAIAPTLIESELFGYEKGAFTGADKNGKPGMLELASGGTLLLDEIGELSLPLQARLLHVLDGQPFYRVGSARPIRMTARILAATNRSLLKMADEGSFRKDLFYRLAVLRMELPPLRERRDDILLLAWHFLARHGGARRLSPAVEKLFLAYDWPGNVRELQSVVQSLATLCDGNIILPSDLPASILAGQRQSAPDAGCATLPQAVAALEKDMLARALMKYGSTYKAARMLGISQSSVVRKARKYGIGGSWQYAAMPEHSENRRAAAPDGGTVGKNQY